MTGRELIVCVTAVARARGVTVRVNDQRGKGNHVTLYSRHALLWESQNN